MSQIAMWCGSSVGFYHHGVLCNDGKTVIHLVPHKVAGIPIALAKGASSSSKAANVFQPTGDALLFASTAFLLGHNGPGRIEETTLDEFLGFPQNDIYDVEYSFAYPPLIAEGRARARIGQAVYSLLFHNCETFARWCVTGMPVSDQVLECAMSVGKVLVYGRKSAETLGQNGTISFHGEDKEQGKSFTLSGSMTRRQKVYA